MLKRILCGFALVLAFCGAARAAELSQEDRHIAQQVIEALGGKELILRAVHQNMAAIRKLRPDITPDKEPLVEREISACVAERITAPGGLADQLLPVFAKRFTKDELRQLAAFYASPVGRKALSELPGALRDARNATQAAAIGMIPELNRRVNAALARGAQEQASGAAQ
jgi:hypothetical protein